MASEPGGIASKLGADYERRYATELLLRLIRGRLLRLQWEPASAHAGGADIKVWHTGGVVEHVQLKRQRASDAEWSVAALQREGVLGEARRVTEGSATARFTFVSSDPVPHLKDICEQLDRADLPADFVRTRIGAQRARMTCFQQLLGYWELDPRDEEHEAIAIDRLRRIRFVLRDRGSDGSERLLDDVQAWLTGPPEVASAHLSDFLNANLGKHVFAADLLDHLARFGIRLQDLASDPALPTALRELREEFRRSLRERLVAGTWLDRSAVGEILHRLEGETSPRIVLVHGKPGFGKSAVLLGVTDGLVDRGIAVLPLSLSARPPTGDARRYGQGLGLGAAPSVALRASAGDRRAVLLVDQLDALRLTTSETAATWDVCTQVLRAALSDPGTVVVVACRTFDLENDANIRRWRDSVERSYPGGVMPIEIGALDAKDIEPILRSVGVEYGTLSPRMQSLLSHPNTLDVWHRLAARGSIRLGFARQTQLLAALIEELRVEAVRIHRVSDREVHETLATARKTMERTGQPVAPSGVFDGFTGALNACCAVGLLVRTGGSVSFPHQSYFDHLVAKAALAASGYRTEEISGWIKRDQFLERREQLRQLLFTLREEDATRAADATRAILLDPDVRFHLKQLVCGVLHEADPITIDDVRLVEALAADEQWVDHLIEKILRNSTNWFDALQRHGTWARLLQRGSSTEGHEAWLRTVLASMKERPVEVDQLLQPLLGEANGATRVAGALSHDPTNDSPAVAAFRDREIKAGRMELFDFSLADLAGRDPGRAAMLAEHSLRARLRRALKATAPGGYREIHQRSFEGQVARAVAADGMRSWSGFSRLLRLAERLRHRANFGPVDADDFFSSYQVVSTLKEVIDVLSRLVAHVVARLADADIDGLRRVLDSNRLVRSPSLSAAVAVGLGQASARASDLAIAWLCEDASRFTLRDSPRRDAYGLAADVVRRHATTCSDNALRSLESLIFTFYPEVEREHYRFLIRDGRWGHSDRGRYVAHVNEFGRAQHLLLTAIRKERRSAKASERLRLWDAKFGREAAERPEFMATGGMVVSPIPHDSLALLGDRQWLDIMDRRWSGRRWSQAGPDRFVEASHQQFSADLAEAAKASPCRFVRLSRSFPPTVPTIYLVRLCQALSEVDVELIAGEVAELTELVARTIDTGHAHAIASACRLVESHAQLEWSETVWRGLEATAGHPDPLSSKPGEEPSISSTSLNSARGAAAGAVAALVWDRRERLARLLPIAKRLAADPHPAVRVAAARAALGIYTTDKDAGVALWLEVVEHADDRILADARVNEVLRYARWSHQDAVRPVIARMVNSAIPEVATLGARWATAERVERGACEELWTECRSGTVPKRIGVATTLGELLLDERADVALAESELARSFDDASPEVRSAAAGAFRVDGLLQSEPGCRLANAFVRSAAFARHADELMSQLRDRAAKLESLSTAVFAAADRFALELAAETRSYQTRLGFAGREMSSLLLRLYDTASKRGDRELASACLDRWDSLLANRVGDADVHIESLSG